MSKPFDGWRNWGSTGSLWRERIEEVEMIFNGYDSGHCGARAGYHADSLAVSEEEARLQLKVLVEALLAKIRATKSDTTGNGLNAIDEKAASSHGNPTPVPPAAKAPYSSPASQHSGTRGNSGSPASHGTGGTSDEQPPPPPQDSSVAAGDGSPPNHPTSASPSSAQLPHMPEPSASPGQGVSNSTKAPCPKSTPSSERPTSPETDKAQPAAGEAQPADHGSKGVPPHNGGSATAHNAPGSATEAPANHGNAPAEPTATPETIPAPKCVGHVNCAEISTAPAGGQAEGSHGGASTQSAPEAPPAHGSGTPTAGGGHGSSATAVPPCDKSKASGTCSPSPSSNCGDGSPETPVPSPKSGGHAAETPSHSGTSAGKNPEAKQGGGKRTEKGANGGGAPATPKHGGSSSGHSGGATPKQPEMGHGPATPTSTSGSQEKHPKTSPCLCPKSKTATPGDAPKQDVPAKPAPSPAHPPPKPLPPPAQPPPEAQPPTTPEQIELIMILSEAQAKAAGTLVT
ncbi:hypothetical protein HDU96_004338 [Phlyctochytrium bullatum]|nr:hypothetical protein HDU96_004338 [Phlyctochytrium bullatum]